MIYRSLAECHRSRPRDFFEHDKKEMDYRSSEGLNTLHKLLSIIFCMLVNAGETVSEFLV